MTATRLGIQHESTEVPKPRSGGGYLASIPRGGLELETERPSRGTLVLAARGEVDMRTAPRLAEMLGCRLRSTLELLVLDLSELGFLAVAGISVLNQAHLQAQNSGVALLIVTGGNRQVERALTVTKKQHNLSLHDGKASDLKSTSATTCWPTPTHRPSSRSSS